MPKLNESLFLKLFPFCTFHLVASHTGCLSHSFQTRKLDLLLHLHIQICKEEISSLSYGGFSLGPPNDELFLIPILNVKAYFSYLFH